MGTTAVSESKTFNCDDIRENFLKINRSRLLRTYESLSPIQRDFLDLLPLLFHMNHPALPGYVTEKTPAGISHYSPTHAAMKAAGKRFPDSELQRRACLQMDIHSLFCMGSSGTIAYSNKSDFDIWLIHSPDLSQKALEELSEKAVSIEKWAGQLRLEVHFFIFDAQTFKDGHHDSLSTESSGTAQHYLLLDEFYRSSLLIAGRYPVWWLVPPNEEGKYENHINELIQSGQIDRSDFVDFGHIADIPADEFFSAAVWQLYKGLSSPFKSVLKLLLMEVYASEYPNIELLSLRFKKTIYTGMKESVDLDPYIMLYKKIEEYLMVRMEKERLDLFRKCFYFKLDLRMSQKVKSSNSNWRRSIVQDMILNWGWDQEKLVTADNREKWRISNVIVERKLLINAFSESYRFLSEFARRHAEVSRVSQAELNVLGRKLYAAFERKTGKVEIINRGIAPDIMENELSFVQARHKDGQDNWLVYANSVETEDEEKTKPLKRSQSLIDLLAWCHFNQIISPNTAISVQSQDRSLTAKDLKDILAAMDGLFPKGKYIKADFDELNRNARIKTASLFINIGIDPQLAADGSQQYPENDYVDALSYGGLKENLAQSFDMIVATSWEEVIVYRYTGLQGLVQCICDYLHWAPLEKNQPPPAISCFSFTSNFANSIARRVEELFNAVINTYYDKAYARDTRYILMIEKCYFILEYQDKGFNFVECDSQAKLLKELGMSRNRFSPVVFDNRTGWETPLPRLYALNQPQTIQMFFSVEKKRVHLYIIDERGSLFTQTMPFYDSQSLIAHFRLFFNSTLQRRNFLLGHDKTLTQDISKEFYLLDKSENRTPRVTRIEIKPNVNEKNYFNIEVMGNLDDRQQTTLTIYCEDREFSSLEHGNEIFTAVAGHVLAQRSSGQSYPIYITDIDLSRSLLADRDSANIQTIHYLVYKKRIEDKLNAALKNLS